MEKIRLIVAQGPLQVITAITTLRFKNSLENKTIHKDYLILGNYCGVELDTICLDIAKSWNFESILSFRNFENYYTYENQDFLTLVKLVNQHLDIPHVDEIYVCRNWQLINETFLNTYPCAKKFCYGDGIGFIDLKNNPIDINTPSLHPNGYIIIDHSYLIAPYHWTIPIDQFPHTTIDPIYLKETVFAAAKNMLYVKELCDNIKTLSKCNTTVILTSNHTESGCFRNVEDEVSCYLECILENADRNNTFLIKGHPREMNKQSHILANALLSYNYDVLLITEPFTTVPIEVLWYYLEANEIFTLFSGSCISLGYLYDIHIHLGIGEKILKKYYNEEKLFQGLFEEHMFSIFTQQAVNSQFKSISSNMKLEINPKSLHSAPIKITKGAKEKNFDDSTMAAV